MKIAQEDLPLAENIHYLGAKAYAELPAYMSGWAVGLLPFAINESTRFISPTKTPEYLAAGLPVVSTPIRDVVRPYGQQDLINIASTAEEFVTAIRSEVARCQTDGVWRARVDGFLAQNSWDQTWKKMYSAIESCVQSTERRQKTSGIDRRLRFSTTGNEQAI